MTYFDVYVGELAEGDDPLDWGGTWEGNTPSSGGPMFPPNGHSGRSDRSPFGMVHQRLSDGALPGKQVDWGAWAVIATKRQILEFLREAYPSDEQEKTRLSFPHLHRQLQEVMDYVNSLSEEKSYALVAEEL